MTSPLKSVGYTFGSTLGGSAVLLHAARAAPAAIGSHRRTAAFKARRAPGRCVKDGVFIGATSEIPAYPNAPGERRCNPSAKLGRRCKKCQKEFRCQVLGEKSQTPYEILQSFPPQT